MPNAGPAKPSNWRARLFPRGWFQLRALEAPMNAFGDAWYKWGMCVRDDIVALECMVCYMERFLRDKYKEDFAPPSECESICDRITEHAKGTRNCGDPGEPPTRPWK